MSHLFEQLTVGGIRLPNRIAVSPMCTYSSSGEGVAADFHMVHLGALAMGGAGLVVQEATAVVPEGRITPACLGLWSDEHVPFLSKIVDTIHAGGAAAGIQLAHAGRKASTWPLGAKPGAMAPDQGGWLPVGPSPIAFGPGHPLPRVLTESEIALVVDSFREAARRAVRAGYDVVEVHAAHGYLLHQFLSPLSNQRRDAYGGSFEGRTRLVLEVVRAVREVVPAEKALLVRVSATDWVEGGWSLEETARLARMFATEGVDLVDVSSGGMVPDAKVAIGPLYQVPFSERIRRESGLPVGAVGMVTTPPQAQEILAKGQADVVFLGRALLQDPYWPVHAAHAMGITGSWPATHLRGAPAGAVARQAFGA
ncbi:MAG: NADH:flavin oxidoreductase/NADH oxidase [Fibrobacterota bacterium]|nr:NADH:flavin oxidoreductase/NADH oxidase [Fibrobacterota bacterium]QQS03453.1 MAG: NADH:flavin oxidoreductase/NADH oxidase [Fibrobacterota bacterium]